MLDTLTIKTNKQTKKPNKKHCKRLNLTNTQTSLTSRNVLDSSIHKKNLTEAVPTEGFDVQFHHRTFL